MANGFGGEPATLEELKSELEQDLYYVDNRSFLLDLKVLLLASLQGLTHKNLLMAIRRILTLPKP
jgi:lipopolysaccharide/colanic/teichoic acid biosynthesis glycosyltransferase